MRTMASQITSVSIFTQLLFQAMITENITEKLCVTGLCVGNSPVIGEFPAQKAINGEDVSIWWRHHVFSDFGHRVQSPPYTKDQLTRDKHFQTFNSYKACYHFYLSRDLIHPKNNISKQTIKIGLNFIGSIAKPPLKLWHIWVTTSHAMDAITYPSPTLC